MKTLDEQLSAYGRFIDEKLDADVRDVRPVRRHPREPGRQRALLVAGVVLAVTVGLGVILASSEGRDADVAAGVGETSTTLGSDEEYRFPPLTPLLDSTPVAVDETTVFEAGGARVTFWLTPVSFGLAEHHATGGSGSMSGESMYAPSLAYMTSGESPTSNSTVIGVTRAEVAAIEWEQADGTVASADTFAHPSFPQVRFFRFAFDGDVRERLVIRALADDGALLTDTDRVNDEHEAFLAAMRQRAGVELVFGRVVTYAALDEEGTSLRLSVRACGGEPQPRWVEDAESVRIRVEIARPIGMGDCTGGAVTETVIGLNKPLGSRRVVDDTTGETVAGH